MASWRRAALVAAGGFAFGVLDLLGRGTLKGNWTYAANMTSVWLSVAFIVGALMPFRRWSAVAGAGVLLAALVDRYVVQLPSLIGRSKRARLFGLLGPPVAARIRPVGFKIIDTINATVF
jgi:hypothetical protein